MAVETVIDTIAEIIIKELTRLKVLKTTEAEILSNALLQWIKAIANNESLDLTLFSCTNLLNACHDYFKAACDERMNVNRNILLLIETLDSISQRNNGPELQVAHPELATTLVLHMGRVLTGLPHHLVMADRIEDPIDPTATSASNDDPAAEKIETDPIPDKPISEEEKKKMKKKKKRNEYKKKKKKKAGASKEVESITTSGDTLKAPEDHSSEKLTENQSSAAANINPAENRGNGKEKWAVNFRDRSDEFRAKQKKQPSTEQVTPPHTTHEQAKLAFMVGAAAAVEQAADSPKEDEKKKGSGESGPLSVDSVSSLAAPAPETSTLVTGKTKKQKKKKKKKKEE